VTNCVPANWETADLLSVAVVTSGQSPPGSTYNTIGEGLPFFQGKAEFGDVSPTPVKWCSAPLRIARPGDVLISVRAPVGPTNLADVECCIGRGLAAITPLGCMPSKFYLYYLRFSVEDLVRQATGTTFQAISGKQLRAHPVLVPPLPEQHQIVQAIESYLTRLDDAVASLERVQRNLKLYRASVLKAAVEGHLVPTEAELAKKEDRSYEPASELLKRILEKRRKKWIENAAEKARAKAEKKADDIKTLEKERAKAARKYNEPAAPDTTNLPDLPEGWCWTSLDQLQVSMVNGLAKRRGEAGAPRHVLRLADIKDGHVVETSPRDIRLTEKERGKYSLSDGDLLCIRVNGSVNLTGMFLPFVAAEAWAFCDHFIRVRLVDALAERTFFSSALNVGTSRHHIAAGMVTTAGQNTVNQSVLSSTPLPLPPLAEQARIAAEISRLLSIGSKAADDTARQTARCARLRQSILKWAFEGKLVEQDPSDPPASVLLERIKAEREAMEPRKKRRSNKKNEPVKHDEQLDLLGGSNK